MGIQALEVLRAERIWTVIRAVQRTVRALAVLVVTFVYASYTLALFPWTRWLAENLIGLVTGDRTARHDWPRGGGRDPRVLRLVLRLVRMFFDAVSSGAVTLEGFESECPQAGRL